ncbi:MAG: AmmeMemoRadiSam system protein B [Ignavibacteria bacterium]|nr:AmmeMemoRadiSam system protein B [Ignavibacteria bacterium]
MNQLSTVRPCAVCGLFYPAGRNDVEQEVRTLLGTIQPRNIEGRVEGLIVPHAGYHYSGTTAAHAFAQLLGRTYRTVVIVSPSHREYFDGVSVYPGDGYATPLGTVPVDTALRSALERESELVKPSIAGHGDEHAIEVQLPFLQCAIGQFMLVPIVMGDQRREYCFELGRALNEVLGNDVLLVASSDLSHYYPATVADKLDRIIRDDVQSFNTEQLMQDLEVKRGEACGGGPIVAVMAALRLRGLHTMHVLHHCNSGDVTGERQSVVGYLSAAACAVKPS